MAHGASCKCSPCGRRGAAQARAWSIRILTHMVKPGRLGKAAREKVGLERKKCRGKAKWEDKDAQHALADEVIEEETTLGNIVGCVLCFAIHHLLNDCGSRAQGGACPGGSRDGCGIGRELRNGARDDPERAGGLRG
ncbi:TY5A [Symbiodinium sp. CCMP2592]|nr:TY5A [Symbiodinium sp. CCMP2592]